MDTNEQAMKQASQAMIRMLSSYELTHAQQIYASAMVMGFLIVNYKAKLDTCINALKDAVNQYEGMKRDK